MLRINKRRSVKQIVAAVGMSIALSITAIGAARATPNEPTVPTPRHDPTSQLHDVADRLLGDLGLTRTGGAYLDGNRLVVTLVGDASHAAGHRQVETKQVRHSLADLNRVRSALDRYARTEGAGQAQSWYVDVRQNRVVLNAPAKHRSRATRMFLRHAEREFPGLVKVIAVDGGVRPASFNLYNSDTIDLTNGMECSVGFNARTSSGRWIFVTAGHCLHGSPSAYRGTYVGASYGRRYPGADYGAILIDTSRWTPRAAVNMHNGMARAVLGAASPLVGSRVCKSSATSGWTCGVIEASGQTVNYGNGNLVYGLVRFSACVEPGDSGGAVMYGNDAVGIVSGAQFYRGGGGLVCGQRVGVQNTSFYQPIGPALRALNARLLTYSGT